MNKTKYQVVLENFINYGEGYDRKITTYSSKYNAECALQHAFHSNMWDAGKLVKYTNLNKKEIVRDFDKYHAAKTSVEPNEE